MIIAIDFDGTIVDHQYPKVGIESPGAFHWMRRFQSLGAKLILYTMRSDGRKDGLTPLSDAVDICKRNGIEFWQVNENKEQLDWTKSPKVYANRYIDDLSVGTPMISHPETGRMVVDWFIVGPIIEGEIRRRLLV